ncbi:hypothetical protein, partial [Dermacoccus nishinomiyaensis]|uniref:hypothetical protein n=1 Tax=Dermacoccus nishinomiyaensis TaxID=1274 RepID=UPI0033A467FE
ANQLQGKAERLPVTYGVTRAAGGALPSSTSPLRAAVPTSRALQRIVKSPADGDFGPNSIRALQRYLNRGVLAGKFKLP